MSLPTICIDTEITIAAQQRVVWSILLDTACYHDWNPYIPRLHGALIAGYPIVFRFTLFGRISLPAKARVLVVNTPTELRWAGHFLADWLFRAEHYHRLETVNVTQTRFAQGEHFSGVLAVLLAPLLRRWAPGRYAAANLALQRYAESWQPPSERRAWL